MHMKCLIFRAKYLWILIGLVVCTQSFGSHAQAGGGNNTGGTNSGGNTNSPQSSPSSSSGGPSTNSGPTGVNLGASILSYEAQENISKDIALRITSSAGTIKHIFITTNLLNSGGALLFYNYIISDLVRLQGSYKKTIDDYNQRSTALNGSLFVPQNILDLAGFVKRLKTGATPTVGPGADLASQYLFGLFSPPLRQRISNYTSGPDTVLQQELIMELNWIIRRGTIYDQNIFPHVKAETQTEVTQASTEPQIVRANRNVIIDEYSPVLQKVAAPQGFIPAPTSLSDATGALTALIGLVSTTTTLNGRTVTPDEMGIIPALAQNLEGKVATTYADLYADASYADSQGSLVQQMINNGKYRAQSDVLMNQILPALPAPIAPPVAVPAAPVVPAAPTPVTPPLSPVSDPRFPNLSPESSGDSPYFSRAQRRV